MTQHKPALRNLAPPDRLDFIAATQAFLDAYRNGATIEACEAAMADLGYRIVAVNRCGAEYEPGRVCRRDKDHGGQHSRVRFNADEDEALR